MDGFSFENQGTNSYLVYTISDQEEIDKMSLGMLTNNKIPGLASTFFTQMDQSKYIKYNISSKISATQFFTGAVNKKRLISVFKGIINAILSAENYMISANSILLDLDYIFVDVSTFEPALICLPILNLDDQNVGNFFKEIMFNTQFDQTESCEYVAKIINFLNASSLFSLDNFKVLLYDIDSKHSVKRETAEEHHKEEERKIPSSTVALKKTNTFNKVLNNKELDQPKIVVSKSTTNNTISEGKIKKQEKKMTFLNLLMHYSKENAELYKSQNEQKKHSQQAKQKNNKKKIYKKVKSYHEEFDFDIPGQNKTCSTEKYYTENFDENKSDRNVTNTVSDSNCKNHKTSLDQSANFGETTVLVNESRETTVLVAAKKANSVKRVTPYLIRLKNQEKTFINKPNFRIGKERSYVDYFIGDNTAISRSHANILTEDDGFFIVDTNSTNHTFINGDVIQSNIKMQIKDGDVIKLANEEFEFRIK